MKLFQLNLINFIGLALTVVLFLVLPSFLIKVLWNTIYGGFLERNLSIDLWQASLLWGAALSLVYMSGLVRIDFQTIESIDLESIDNPDLREKIRKLKEEKGNKRNKDFETFELDPKKKEEIIEHLKRSFAMTPDDVQELRSEMYKKLKEEQENLSEESEAQSQKKKSEDEDS